MKKSKLNAVTFHHFLSARLEVIQLLSKQIRSIDAQSLTAELGDNLGERLLQRKNKSDQLMVIPLMQSKRQVPTACQMNWTLKPREKKSTVRSLLLCFLFLTTRTQNFSRRVCDFCVQKTHCVSRNCRFLFLGFSLIISGYSFHQLKVPLLAKYKNGHEMGEILFLGESSFHCCCEMRLPVPSVSLSAFFCSLFGLVFVFFVF